MLDDSVAAGSKRNVKYVAQAAIFFSLMPYIGFTFLPTDVQPIAFLVCSLGVAPLLATGRLPLYWVALPLWAMSGIATLSLLALIGSGEAEHLMLLRSYYGYVAAPIIVTFMLYYLRFVSGAEIARAIDLALAVALAGFVLNMVGLTWVIQLVVNRAVAEEFFGGARGLTGFFPEPSRVSEQMAGFFFAYLLTGQLTRLRTAGVVAATFVSAAGQMFVVFGHLILGYILALLMVFVLSGGLSKVAALRFAIVGVTLVAVLVLREPLTDALIAAGFPSRGLSAVGDILRMRLSYVGQDEGILFKISGVLHAAATLGDNPTSFQLAAAADPGFAATIERGYAALIQAIFGTTLLVYPSRTYSALGTWIVDFGLIGLVTALWFIGILLYRGLLAKAKTRLHVLWASFFLAQVFFVKVALANPALWFLAALIWVVTKAPEPSTLIDSEVALAGA